jgi:putative oxidoreductase
MIKLESNSLMLERGQMKYNSTRFYDQAWALFLVRVTLGSIFMLHGSQKVLGLFGGSGLEGFVKWLGGLGVPPALGYLAALAEFVGGILLFFGIAAELGALMIIPVMLGAIFIVHWGHGYFGQQGGFEYPLNLILFLCAVIIGGPGKCALWNPFKSWRD